jgi:hypothetical protein
MPVQREHSFLKGLARCCHSERLSELSLFE